MFVLDGGLVSACGVVVGAVPSLHVELGDNEKATLPKWATTTSRTTPSGAAEYKDHN